MMTSLKKICVCTDKYSLRQYQQIEKKGKLWGTFAYSDTPVDLCGSTELPQTISNVQDFLDKIMAGDGPALAKLATAWFLFFTVKYHLDLRRIATWPSTIGELNEFRYLGASNHNDPLKMIAYSYEVDGKAYKGSNTNLAYIRMSGPSAGSRIKKMMRRVQRIGDDKVVVFYNPYKPRKSLLLKPSSTEYGFLILLYVATLGVAYLGFIHPG